VDSPVLQFEVDEDSDGWNTSGIKLNVPDGIVFSNGIAYLVSGIAPDQPTDQSEAYVGLAKGIVCLGYS
jgi:hypothetical protein